MKDVSLPYKKKQLHSHDIIVKLLEMKEMASSLSRKSQNPDGELSNSVNLLNTEICFSRWASGIIFHCLTSRVGRSSQTQYSNKSASTLESTLIQVDVPLQFLYSEVKYVF